jgi:tryptophan synthase alpha chain
LSTIDDVFEVCRSEKRAAFIPYITAGDPDLRTSRDLLLALARAGADIIELGIPFSDPIADGPVNQRAALRSLEAGTKLSGIFDLVAGIREELNTPIVLFTYFNPIHARGLERFADQAAASGVDGVLCVDLPVEEATSDYLPTLQSRSLDTVFLLAPTSTRDRIRQADESSSGFVYYVSRTGVTGDQGELPSGLLRDAKLIRRRVKKPLAVGFGISLPEQAGQVARVADGVVVGSALVRKVEEAAGSPALAEILEDEALGFSEALRG